MFSDLHSQKNNYKEEIVSGVFGAIGKSALPVSSVTSAGDAFSVNEGYTDYTGYTKNITDPIQAVFDVPVNFAWSDHDRSALLPDGSKVDKTSHLVYGAGSDKTYGTDDDANYYVYVLSMADMSTNDRYGLGFINNRESKGFTSTVEQAIANFKADTAVLDKTKPLFIASHMPLRERRGDNGNAFAWYQAITEVAGEMDVIFFSSHNHDYDVPGDYYVAKGGSMDVAGDKVNTELPMNFTHLTAGYMDPATTDCVDENTRQGVAVAVVLYEKSIDLVAFDNGGVYDGDVAPLNANVKRDFVSADEPTEPSEPTDPSEPTEPEQEPVVDSNNTGVAVTSPKVEKVEAEVNTADPVVEAAVEELLTNYISYDITVEGEFEEGDVAVVAVPAPADLKNPAVYYVADDGSTERMKVTGYEDGVVTFETTHFSTYTVGDSTVIDVPNAGTASGSKEETTTQSREVYVQVADFNGAGDYLIANTNTATSNGNLLTATTYQGYSDAGNTGNVVIITGTTASGDTKTYIEDPRSNNAIWTATASGNGYVLRNTSTGRYLYGGNNGVYAYSQGTTWYSSNNRVLKYSNTRYIEYDNGWDVSSSSRNVYLYKKQPVEFAVTTSEQGSYAIEGIPASIDELVTTEAAFTKELGAKLTYTPTSGDPIVTNPTTGVKYEVYRVTDANGVTVDGDPNGIISGFNGNEVTFTGKTGKALIQVSYTTEFGKVTNYIPVSVQNPYYTGAIKYNGEDVTNTTVPKKSAVSGSTIDLDAEITYTDATGTSTPDGTWEWNIPEEYQNIATVDSTTGVVTFKGIDGAFYVTATFTEKDTLKQTTLRVNVTAAVGSYTTPDDGATEFPEYPNEGAIRYDKTATAVGNSFSDTGIAKVELSMTGVNYTKGNEIDVVLMVDMSGSMDNSGRLQAAKNATSAAVEALVYNKGQSTLNKNRVAVYTFYGQDGFSNSPEATVRETRALDTFDDVDELRQLIGTKQANGDYTGGTIAGWSADGGTPYNLSLQKCWEVLDTARKEPGYNREQYVIFVTDGAPGGVYYYLNTNNQMGTLDNIGTGYESNITDHNLDDYTEYYSYKMKEAGVEVYSVAIQLGDAPTSKAVLKGIAGAEDAEGTVHTAKEADYAGYYQEVEGSADTLTDVFLSIVSEIMQAATDVTVEDQMGDNYSMIFDIPAGPKTITGVTDDFYIEFVEHNLVAQYTPVTITEFTPRTKYYTRSNTGVYTEVTGSYQAGTQYYVVSDYQRDDTGATSKIKLYLNKDAQGKYYAASNNSGTAFAAPTFEAKTLGDKGTLLYWTTLESYASKAALSYKVGDTTYYFIPTGQKLNANGTVPTGWYNMTAGAYAYGTTQKITVNGSEKDSNLSNDLIIATPYFVYNAATKMLYWTVERITTTEYALTYFLYLENSATHVGTPDEAEAQSYLTNHHAYLNYTNFNGTECRQEFPVPQMSWNGAQAFYTFYLVNTAGQPINRSGQVVDFANATFIVEPIKTEVVWNKALDGTSDGSGELSADWLADNLLPDTYMIYDTNAHFELHVYEKETGETILNQFTIDGSTPADIATSLQTRLGLQNKPANTSAETTKVYNTKGGIKYDDYGTYTSKATTAMDDEIVLSNFDFANTTVAFAVVWEASLVPDTVVVDYGLDTLIDVVRNDVLKSNVTGISQYNTAYGNIPQNFGISVAKKFQETSLNIDGNQITVENENSIRFKQKDMEFKDPVVFYYETPVNYWENSNEKNGYMHSKVTVIPATTVYYEDSFIAYTVTGDGQWVNAGQENTNVTQDQDRPGFDNLYKELDKNNVYGYDGNYSVMSAYSMGSAKKITVKSGVAGHATFSFYGTGFDIISMTSNDTGLITVQVMKEENGETVAVKTLLVDTYYGVNASGQFTNEGALYQIPVIKVKDLPYGKYTVSVNAAYTKFFDHVKGSTDYDFYLDAIRIYDPTGNQNTTVNNYYVQDGEGWPVYQELRNNVIAAADFNALPDSSRNDKLNGIAFIDSADNTYNVADYISYGPNNELYLANGQAVVFGMDLDAVLNKVDRIHLGLKNATAAHAQYAIIEADDMVEKAVELTKQEVQAIEKVAVDALGENATNEAKDNAKIAALKNLLKDTYGLTDEEIPADLTALETLAAEMIYPTKTQAAMDSMPTTELKTSTDMYYDITDLFFEMVKQDNTEVRQYKNPLVIIRNSGTGILSLTNIKTTFTQNPGEIKDLFYVDYETITKTLENADITWTPDDSYAEEDTTVSNDSIEMTVHVPEKVVAGRLFTAEVWTTGEVVSVMIGNQPAETADGEYWLLDMTLDGAGTVEVPITAKGVDGSEVTMTANILVRTDVKVEAPSVVLPGASYTVKITADADATVQVVRNGNTVAETELNEVSTTVTTYTTTAGGPGWDDYIITATVDGVETVMEVSVEICDATVTVSPSTTDQSAGTINCAVKTGETVTFTITTNSAIELVTVDGEPVTTYRAVNQGKENEVRTWTAKRSWDAIGNYDVEVVLSHEDGYELDLFKQRVVVTHPKENSVQSGNATVTVYPTEMGQNGTLDCSVKTGETVTFTIRTNNTIKQVTVYGEAITTYTTENQGAANETRVWTAKRSWNKAGNYDVSVVLHDGAGNKQEILKQRVVVTATSTVENIINAISWIANTIRGWFSR